MKKNKLREGFAIVEVLVAFIILSMTIAVLTYSQKNFFNNIKRLENYEKFYTTVLSLKSKIDLEIRLGNKQYFTGNLNGYNYQIELQKKSEKRNLRFDEFSKLYTKGAHIYTLYEVNIWFPELKKRIVFDKLKTEIDRKALSEFQ